MNDLINIGMQNNLTLSYPKHSHRFWEITYYFEGTGVNVTGGKEYPFSAGTVICQPPGIEHEDISSGYKNIYFLVAEFNLSVDTPLVVNDSPNMDFLYILKKMYTEYHLRGKSHKRITGPLLHVLYIYLLDFTEYKFGSNYVSILEKQLVENLSNPGFSVLEAISKMPMSENHFRRLFKKETGKSPQRYLQDLRIAYSMQLLKNSSLPLKNICRMSGYSDPYYFSRIFKNHTNLSPDHWRKT